MQLHFFGDTSELTDGIHILSKELGFEVSSSGLKVQIVKRAQSNIEVSKNGDALRIAYSERIHFFRALGLLVEALREKEQFAIVEEPQFTMNGAMFDVSQGSAVIKVENFKKLLIKMAVMGLNMLMIYSEDSYEMQGEPFFGYMRSKYTYEELKELDDYADVFGIEMIPCIQTLAHMIDALKWSCYEDIRQELDILYVGCEKAYVFIEKLITTAAAPFRSKRIHIGMDEAWKLNQGKYLLENGLRDRTDIMNEHLGRVMDITRKHGLEPMIWSDMYFRGHEASEAEMFAKMPKDLQYVFWDYYHPEEDFYAQFLLKHKRFTPNPIFAGGIWTWAGYGADYNATFKSTNAALPACKKAGVKEVFATIWGDDTCESQVYSTLLGLQLYAEHGYSRELDTEKLQKRFKFCTGAEYEGFMDMMYLEVIPSALEKEPNSPFSVNPSKYLMWQDIFLGLFDKNIAGLDLTAHYSEVKLKMEKHMLRNGEYNFLFVFLAKVCAVLELKAEMGIRLTEAYQNKEYNVLKHIAETELPELARRVQALKHYHRELWMETNKPMGWEVLDLRYGMVKARTETIIYRLTDYLQGRIKVIEELEQERQLFHGRPGLILEYFYNNIPTASRISMTTFYTPW
jgi:hexosaminidase